MIRGISPSSIPQARSGLRNVINGVDSLSSYLHLSLPYRTARLLTAVEEEGECLPERLVGEEADVIEAAGAAFEPDLVEERLDRLPVRLAERPGFGEHLFIPLDV